jgi:pimeloyl-ACP methyl ester carboxylesterase
VDILQDKDILTKQQVDDDDDQERTPTAADVQELYLTQSLDHFRLEDARTYPQRYFYTNRYVRTNNEYVNATSRREYAFLCVGGEGPALTKAVLVNAVHCTGDMLETARRLYEGNDAISIHLYALEHRYYGKSFPTFAADNNATTASPLTNEHLVYLSSRQAQADLAHFVSTTTILHDGNIPWITFGGSYPGVLAAYARLRVPHAVAAAVSHSAPLQATLDFTGYKNHVANVLANADVGGSFACLDVFVQGHADLVGQVQEVENHERLGHEFLLCNATQLASNPRNVQLFLGDGVAFVGTQENDPSCTKDLCNIAKKCALVLDYTAQGATPAEALAKLVRLQKHHNREGCTNLDWEENVAYVSDPLQAHGWRSWLWQTCTEFGFYQTCEIGSACPFGQGYHPLSQDLELCERAFGVAAVDVAKAVQESLDYYGGLNIATTRILSVNGNIDPWSELALVHSENDDLPAFVVNGASHHFWTHAVKETDSVDVMGARQLIYSTVKKWLDEIDVEWAVRRRETPPFDKASSSAGTLRRSTTQQA